MDVSVDTVVPWQLAFERVLTVSATRPREADTKMGGVVDRLHHGRAVGLTLHALVLRRARLRRQSGALMGPLGLQTAAELSLKRRGTGGQAVRCESLV